jgi:predicted chitinase
MSKYAAFVNLQSFAGAKPDGLFGPDSFAKCSRVIGADNNLLAAAFWGQIYVETAGLSTGEEKSGYTVSGARSVFGARVSHLSDAELMVLLSGDQSRFFSLVYANRNGNGPPSSMDGWHFRGAGPIQWTGRSNWEQVFGRSVSHKDREILVSDHTAFFLAYNDFVRRLKKRAGGVYHKMQYSPTSSASQEWITDWDITQITRAVNGGKMHVAKRIKKTREFLSYSAISKPSVYDLL